MSAQSLEPISGEFACPEREAAFRTERLPETIRHARLLFAASAVLNLLFLVSDWRFFGEPHFWVAVPARLAVVAVSLIAFAVIRRVRTFRNAQRVMLAWEAGAALGVALLVSSRSDIALYVVMMLPAIYLLVVPTAFIWTVVAGGGCAALLMAGYMLPPPLPSTALGLVLAVLMSNTALGLVVVRSNRLRRLEWTAMQSERRANEELAQSRRLMETLFRAVPIPVVVRPLGAPRIVHANDAALTYFGGDPANPDLTALARVQVRRADRDAMGAALQHEGRIGDVETTLRLADGGTRNVLVSAATVVLRDETHVVASVVDITSRKAAEDRVWRAAHHDALTGLPNRALFQSRLETLLASAEREGGGVGLILADLDRFKEINDTLGHDAGDALLKEAACRLGKAVGADGFVARLGGDEFVLVVCAPERGPELASRMLATTDNILDALRTPYELHDGLVSPRAAIGFALFPDHAASPADLLKNADLALYAAKTGGRDRAVSFDPAMRTSVERRTRVARQMRNAIADGALVPYYQPKICLATGAVSGFEALARWVHPTRGLLGPDAFSSVFEDREIAIALGERMIRQAADDMRGWIERGLEPGRAAVNLSTAQFAQPDLAERILDLLSTVQLAPDRFEVEVTETVLLGKAADRVAAVLETLHGAGVRVALDDFGTGYASLTHLKQFPVSQIKVDRSFVRGVERDADDSAIVTAVIQLGRSLGLDVTAEGVETEGQALFLRQRDCAFAQGYLFAKPMAASRVPWFLETRAGARVVRFRQA